MVVTFGVERRVNAESLGKRSGGVAVAEGMLDLFESASLGFRHEIIRK